MLTHTPLCDSGRANVEETAFKQRMPPPPPVTPSEFCSQVGCSRAGPEKTQQLKDGPPTTSQLSTAPGCVRVTARGRKHDTERKMEHALPWRPAWRYLIATGWRGRREERLIWVGGWVEAEGGCAEGEERQI